MNVNGGGLGIAVSTPTGVDDLQEEILKKVAHGAPLTEVLVELCTLVQEKISDSICSVMLLDDRGALQVGTAPSVPRELLCLLDGLEPGPLNGSCGRAAFTGEPVIVEDTHTDPAWENIRSIAKDLGIRACWSHPIFAGGDVVGTFAISHTATRTPDREQQALLHTSAHLAGIAVTCEKTRREHRALEDQLYQAQRMEAIGQLASGVAHDFGNLVTVILGSADALASAAKRPDRERVHDLALGQIRSAGKRAADLIQQLLRFGSPSPLQLQWLDPNQAIAEIEMMLRPIVNEQIRWQVIPLEVSPRIYADPTRFQQLVVNLVMNAADAMPEGGELTISLAREAGTGAFRLEIGDTGCGISEEDRQKVFDPFFTTKPPHEGTGLGLASVRATVESHGGTIDCSSTLGEGTTFAITLPNSGKEEGENESD